jgi:uncharacterized protein (DUF1330 family)
MKAYVIAAEKITDSTFDVYRKAVSATVASFGGQF